MKIAMVQFDADFLKVQENKAKAESYVAEAVVEHADMILFPEFFTTGFALNMGIYQAVAENKDIREWMAGLSRKNHIIIGGSFLEYDEQDGNIYNAYGLFFPEGQSYFHRKDIPTALEAFCYKGGDECVVFDTPAGRVGIAMCWEMLRTDTFNRMKNKVDYVIAGSCWWGFAKEDGDAGKYLQGENRMLARKAPGNLAEILKRPVFHSSVSGTFEGGNLMGFDVCCKREIESVSGAFDENGMQLCDSRKEPGIVYAFYDEGKEKQECILNKDGKYWLMEMSKPLEDGFYQLTENYGKFYEKRGKVIFQEMIQS